MRKITDRGVVYVGYSCNLNCNFCYYGLYGKKRLYELEKIKKDIETISGEYKNEKIDITGGEPTIHPRILEIVNYARKIGLEPRIITNGILLERKDFCKELFRSGIDEFLISIHGPREIHDLMSVKKGSFESVSRSVMNLNSWGIPFSSNTVITIYNYHVLPQVTDILFSLGSRACNFIMFNPFESWTEGDVNRIAIENKKAAPYIKEALDICKNNSVKGVVRYFPFCALRGYERFICNFAQLSYDESEWDFKSWIRNESPNSERDYFQVAQMLNRAYYIESGKCKKCGVQLICGGIKKKLAPINLEDTESYRIEAIEDPLYFRDLNSGE